MIEGINGLELIRSDNSQDTRRELEMTALLEGARAVLQYKKFQDAARAIFDKCKEMTGATSGYVALLSADGSENEVLFLDPGGRKCIVDPELPMPIRGLRETAYRFGKAVCENNFATSKWWDYLPEGHVTLDNVLFSPLIIGGKVVGLIGLANKPCDFDENDLRIATAFGEFAAIALYNSQTLKRLENSEQRFRNVVEAAGDAIISIDSDDNITTWNRSAEVMFGYTTHEALSSPVTIIIPQQFRDAHKKGIHNVATTGISKYSGKILDLEGIRRDGTVFPLELSLTKWYIGDKLYFTAIIRDITKRRQDEDELKRFQTQLQDLVYQRTASLIQTNKSLEEEIGRRLKIEQELQALNRNLTRVVNEEVRKNREKEQLMFEQSRQLALSELLISIAHHWRQPLSAIGAIVQNLEDAFDYNEIDEEFFHNSVKKIVDELIYLSKTIDNFSSFYRRDKEKKLFSVYDCLEKNLIINDDYIKSKKITVEIEREEDIQIEGYFNEFSRVILNVFNNIKDVFDERDINNGYIKIRIFKDIETGKTTLSIADNGGGISRDIRPMIFDPYFTTKHKSRGTGLGLYMAKVIIENNFNGNIRVNSTEDGSEFIIEV
ncbi:MAG: PAS domain S-box protein [Nitrospirae bacterium]|nr:PAS domain S-box protein [Nitrospirota bacterium]